MADLENLKFTTVDFENRIAEGKKFNGVGYPNRIRLRQTSYANALEKLATYSKNDALEATDTKIDSGYTISDVNIDNVSMVAPSKPIMLKGEKFNNIKKNLNIAPTVQEEKKEQEDTTIEVPTVDTEKNEPVVEDKEEKNEEVVPMVAETSKQSSNDIAMDNSEIDKVYEQIQKETEETLRAKETALKAQKSVETVKLEIKQKMEESDARVLEKSTEQAEMRARKEAALTRKQEIDRSIIAAFSSQRQALTLAKEKYLKQQETSQNEINELQKQAELKAQENSNKIVEFQRTIDQDRNDLTEVENEIARKEAILKALSNPLELNNPSVVNEEEKTYKKVA